MKKQGCKNETPEYRHFERNKVQSRDLYIKRFLHYGRNDMKFGLPRLHLAMTVLQRYTAFTLAEVLVTLMIIGVVGALTIPAFIANHQKKVYATSLKKFYSSFNSGMQKYMAEKGCIGDLSGTGMFKYSTLNGSAKPLLDTMIKPTFNVLKTCASNDKSCINGPIYTFGNTKNADPGWMRDARAYMYKTIDGMIVWLYIADGLGANYINCTATGNSYSKATPVCAGIAVDINGDKPPNNVGIDYFVFYLANNGYLYPRGGMEMAKFSAGINWKTNTSYWATNGTNACTTSNHYVGCAARIMDEGWEMTY